MKTYKTHVLVLAAALISLAAYTAASTNDDKIESAFKNSYVYKTYLSSDSIKIECKNGIVTLTGTVKEDTHKPLAQETAENLPGVTRVENKLEVAGGGILPNSDAWIAAQIRASLLFHSKVSAATSVDVTNGVVTLRGTADSLEQKNLTAEYAKAVDNVTDVKNEMTVGAPAPGAGLAAAATVRRDTHEAVQEMDDASITAQVKMALLLDRSTSSLNTKVKTVNGLVTLTGQAATMNEMAHTTKLVSDVNGVKGVANHMTIGPS